MNEEREVQDGTKEFLVGAAWLILKFGLLIALVYYIIRLIFDFFR